MESRRDNPGVCGTSLLSALEQLTVHAHLCLIYETREEQFAAVVPFMKIGLEHGEQCVYIADENTAAAVLEAMRAGGIDTESAIASGALAVVSKRDAYLREGYFDPDHMIDFLKESTDAAKAAGYSALRATGEMTWMLGGEPGVERLIEYEAKLNYFFPKYDALAICQYNRSRFSPELLIDVIYTHPLVIFGGTVCRNFYYIPPDEFLRPGRRSREVERVLGNILERERYDIELRESRDRLESINEELRREIAEREREEREIARLAAIVESSDDAIISKDLNGTILTWNRGAEDIYGYPADEAVGRPISMLAPPDQPGEIPHILEEIRHGKRIETKRVRKDGRRIYVSLTISPIKDAAGRIVGSSTIAREITEQKLAEEALRAASLYARSLIEASLDPLVTISREGKITDVNHATELVTGVPRDRLIGSDFSDYFTEPEKARAGYEQAFREGSVRDYPLAIRHVSGRITDVLYNATVYRDENGDIQGVFAAARDITERKRAETELTELTKTLERRVAERTAELEAANKEMEAFSYSVSHDLRAPLRSIDGFSLALFEDYADKLDPLGQDYLTRVRQAAQRMGKLIDDMLRLSRVTRAEMHYETVDLSAMAREILSEFQREQPDRKVEIIIHPDIVAEGDLSLLQIALENLLDNAWKFTGRKPVGRIEFGVTHKDGERIYYVRDNGAGFDMAYVDKLFNPFQRLHPETEFPGTGIGLAIVQRIIRRHGGRVWAEGKVDAGATFYFTL
ncbi:MAG: MEDS domain-containing protein [Armatimonadota bacterium]